uniref:Uncharacterized protein n=1 Tax=Phytophthora ramorum TaxID=164328 RepID=H3GHP5_PHYRM
MARVTMLLSVFAALLVGIASAKILTLDEWPRTSTPLATVTAAIDIDNITDVGALTSTKISFKSSGSDNDSLDSDDADSTDSVIQAALSSSSDEHDEDGSETSPNEASDSDDDVPSTVSGSGSSDFSASSNAMSVAFTTGSVMNATSTIEATYVNWVGSELDTSFTSVCYRESHIAKTCPLGFNSEHGMCWAQCPYSYPVECGLECIRQNDDCALEVAYKVGTVVQSTMSFVTMNLFGAFYKVAKGIQQAFKCVKSMLGLTKSLVKYIRYAKVSDPESTQDKILAVLYQTDNVVIDIPVAVAYCLGIKVSDSVKFADRVLTTAEFILREAVKNSDTIVSSWDNFESFMKNITLGESISSLNQFDITSLKSAMESNSTCGYDMKRLLDRTWMTVAELLKTNPGMSEDDIRVAMSQSNLVLKDIPIATNNCMNDLIADSDEKTAYATRDTLRKTFASIMDDLISSGTSSNGTFLSAKEYAFKVADKALGFYAIWDMWVVTGIVSEFFQPICGPTQLIGEIDDGTAEKALGMTIVQDAFNNSDGLWKKEGDGTVIVTFKSVDTEDVSVNIKSGGDKVAEVPVPAGQTVMWKSNVTRLGGKTLYLDRWRPGFMGLPGTGGGSLLLWVPQSTQGSMRLTAVLNVS